MLTCAIQLAVDAVCLSHPLIYQVVAHSMERFDPVSAEIIAWANKSENEEDGRSLIQVIRLVYNVAINNPTSSQVYALLCRRMMEGISSRVQDKDVRDAEGRPMAGAQLFRTYLLNRCQADFERGWAAHSTAENDKSRDTAPRSNEDYTARWTARRLGLGLIKFMGELFNVQLLTERITHECVKKFLDNIENPEEEEIESLCMLLTTAGALLDTPKARPHMDVYFERMRGLTRNPNVGPRMQAMLQDVNELRERGWAPVDQDDMPHSAVSPRGTSMNTTSQPWRTSSISRSGSSYAGNRTQGAADASRRFFGGRTGSRTDAFAKNEDKGDPALLLRDPSILSMENPELATEVATARTSCEANPETTPQRRKLNLLPRTLPRRDETRNHSTLGPLDSAAPSTSQDEAQIRVGEDSKELFSVVYEAEV